SIMSDRGPDMEQSRRCSACGPIFELNSIVPLGEVQAELEPIEALALEIGDLTAMLRALLSPEQFRLVWSLQDAVERLGLAEGILREHRLIDGLARHLPDSATTI